MSPDRIKRIREKLAEAKAKGATDDTTVDIMVLTVGELSDLLDRDERYDQRTSELLESNNKLLERARTAEATAKAATELAQAAAERFADTLA